MTSMPPQGSSAVAAAEQDPAGDEAFRDAGDVEEMEHGGRDSESSSSSSRTAGDNNDFAADVMSSTTAAAPLPSMEDMEDLILEAYNNMQSDGEHIFLPPDVASKLHYIAQLVKTAGYISDDVVSIGSEPNQEGALPAGGVDDDDPSVAAGHLNDEIDTNVHIGVVTEPNQQEHDEEEESRPVDESSSFTKDQVEADGKGEPGDANRSAPSPKENNDDVMLAPVQELSDEALTGNGLDTAATHPSTETLSPSPSPAQSLTPTRGERPRTTSPSLLKKPVARRRTSIPEPTTDVRRKSSSTSGRPSSIKNGASASASASTTPRAPLSNTHAKSESAPPPPPPSSSSSSRERVTTSSYEQRREAAQKLKEDKALRDLQARDSVRKQREEARRKLEDAQQKELEAKRERVARMKMQKEQRKGGATRPSTVR